MLTGQGGTDYEYLTGFALLCLQAGLKVSQLLLQVHHLLLLCHDGLLLKLQLGLVGLNGRRVLCLKFLHVGVMLCSQADVLLLKLIGECGTLSNTAHECFAAESAALQWQLVLLPWPLSVLVNTSSWPVPPVTHAERGAEPPLSHILPAAA